MRTTFIVTGAGRGLGARTVEALASHGGHVVAVDIDSSSLENTVAEGRKAGGEIEGLVADVAEPEGIIRAVDEARTRWGGLDGIFNNAGIEGQVAGLERYTEADFDRVMRVNVRSVFVGMKYALPALVDAGEAAIVNTASTGGIMGWPQLSGYVASKHAVVGLTRTIALEYAGKGVRANVVCPGPMDTPMMWKVADLFAAGDRKEAERSLRATIPVGRLGRPEEVAATVSWLLREGPEYFTGAVVPVDGAQTAGQHG